MFRDRTEAGKRLAAEVAALALRDPVVLALPRGGVPVAELSELADRVVCLDQPPHFEALGYHYGEFHQLRDAEVLDYLARASAGRQPETGKPS